MKTILITQEIDRLQMKHRFINNHIKSYSKIRNILNIKLGRLNRVKNFNNITVTEHALLKYISISAPINSIHTHSAIKNIEHIMINICRDILDLYEETGTILDGTDIIQFNPIHTNFIIVYKNTVFIIKNYTIINVKLNK